VTASSIDQLSGIDVIKSSLTSTDDAIHRLIEKPQTLSPLSVRRPANSVPMRQSKNKLSGPAIILPIDSNNRHIL
jgi:hypothetical protein